MIVWLTGKINKSLVETDFNNNAEVQQIIISYLETIIFRDLSDFKLEYPLTKKHAEYTNVSYKESLDPNSTDFLEMLNIHIHNAVKEFQTHSHTFSCYKNDPNSCRLRKPDEIIKESLFNIETGKFEIKCLDGMINNFNIWLTLFVNSNTDVQILLRCKEMINVMYYITSYITKESDRTEGLYTLAFAAKKSLTERPFESTVEINNRVQSNVRALLIRLSFQIMRATKISSNIVITMLLGLPMHYKSHAYERIQLYPIICILHNIHNKKLINDYEINVLNNEEVLISFEGYKLYNCSIDYSSRPISLEFINFYHFKRFLNKTLIKNAEFRFNLDHPQFKTHGLSIRKNLIIPDINFKIPKRNHVDEIKQLEFKFAILGLLEPWRLISLQKLINLSSITNFKDWESKTNLYIKNIIKNIDNLNETKEEELNTQFSESKNKNADEHEFLFDSNEDILYNENMEFEDFFTFDELSLEIPKVLNNYIVTGLNIYKKCLNLENQQKSNLNLNVGVIRKSINKNLGSDWKQAHKHFKKIANEMNDNGTIFDWKLVKEIYPVTLMENEIKNKVYVVNRQNFQKEFIKNEIQHFNLNNSNC